MPINDFDLIGSYHILEISSRNLFQLVRQTVAQASGTQSPGVLRERMKDPLALYPGSSPCRKTGSSPRFSTWGGAWVRG